MPFPQGSPEWSAKVEEERYKYQSVIGSFAQFPLWQGKRVLEVGSGCGTDLLQFARHGAEAVGIDLSRRSLSLARKRQEQRGLRAGLVEADAEKLPFPSGCFDLVYSWGVIHHSPNPDKVVWEIERVLRPGGQLKAMVYHRFSYMGLRLYLKHGLLKGRPFVSLSRLFSQYQESPETKAYSRKEVVALFSAFAPLKIRPILTIEKAKLDYMGLSWMARFLPPFLASWLLVEGKKPAQEGKPGLR